MSRTTGGAAAQIPSLDQRLLAEAAQGARSGRLRGRGRGPGGQSSPERPGQVVVDEDDVAAGPVQQAGRDPGAVAGPAAHPEAPAGDLGQAAGQLTDGQVAGARARTGLAARRSPGQPADMRQPPAEHITGPLQRQAPSRQYTRTYEQLLRYCAGLDARTAVSRSRPGCRRAGRDVLGSRSRVAAEQGAAP
jgi:hypothetical protein